MAVASPHEAPSVNHTLTPLPRAERRALRIAVLAPPWITVPPPAYGGIEAVVALLCDELVARGHDVTLFAAPGSRSPAHVCSPLESDARRSDRLVVARVRPRRRGLRRDRPRRRGRAAVRRRARPLGLHRGRDGAPRLGAGRAHPARAVQRRDAAVLRAPRPQGHGSSRSAASSSSTRRRACASPTSCPTRSAWRTGRFARDKDDYLLWMGRMDPVKGAHRAIAAARRRAAGSCSRDRCSPGRRSTSAVRSSRTSTATRSCSSARSAGCAATELFARAKAFLMPIRWAEPFGMVMVEALACGTPVIAFPEGAASEIVIDGENGFHVADEQEMAEAIRRLGAIDPARCRAERRLALRRRDRRRRLRGGLRPRDPREPERRAPRFARHGHALPRRDAAAERTRIASRRLDPPARRLNGDGGELRYSHRRRDGTLFAGWQRAAGTSPHQGATRWRSRPTWCAHVRRPVLPPACPQHAQAHLAGIRERGEL